MLHGEQSSKFVGADEVKFRNALGKLQIALSGKASEHMNQTFQQFKPMHRMATSFPQVGQKEKMQTFIRNLANASANKVRSTTNIIQWIDGGFNLEAIPQAAIDELCELAQIAEDKAKIAISDLFRLLVLKDTQAEYILTNKW